MIKKKVAVIVTASALTAAMATTAFAAPGAGGQSQLPKVSQTSSESTESGQMPPQMNGNQAPEGMENGQMPPQMNGNQAPEGMESGQMPPQMNGNQAPEGMENGQMPPMGGMPGGPEGGMGMAPAQISFDRLVQNNVISQTTYEAIMNYLKENAPEMPQGNFDPSNGQKEMSDNSELPEIPDLLADLLRDGVITQDEYDALSAEKTEAESNMPKGLFGDFEKFGAKIGEQIGEQVNNIPGNPDSI